jgi:putative ABC transport system permease protein
MQLLTLSQLRHHLKHRLQTLLAILGVALGVAVVNAVDITQYSTKQNLLRAQQQLNGRASHRVVGTGLHLKETLYAQLRRDLLSQYPEISLTPILKQTLKPKNPSDTQWIVLGIDPLSNTTLTSFSTMFTGTEFTETEFKGAVFKETGFKEAGGSEFLTRDNAAFISSALATNKAVNVGDSLTLSLIDRQWTLQVAGIFADSINADTQHLIVMDIGNTQSAFDRAGQLSSIDLQIPPERSDLVELIKRRLPQNTQLLTVEQLIEGQLSLVRALEFNLSALSFLSLIVGAFLIFSTVRFSILQRTPSFARLRVQGVSHRELHKLLSKEALLLSALGISVGWTLGYALSYVIAPISHQTITNLYALETSSNIVVYWPLYLKTAMLGLLTTLISYYFSYKSSNQLELSHTIARIHQELKPEKRSSSKHLSFVGHSFSRHIFSRHSFALLILILALLLLKAPLPFVSFSAEDQLLISYLATVMIALSALLLIPSILTLFYPLVLSLASLIFGSTGLIALRDCQRESSRVLLAIMALCLAVAATNGIAIMIDSFRHSVNQWIDSQLNADIYLRLQTSTKIEATKIETTKIEATKTEKTNTRKLIQQLQNNPSVQCLSFSRNSKTFIDDKWLPLNAIELPGCQKASLPLISNKTSTAYRKFAAGQVFISEPLARKKRLNEQDSITLHTEQGKRSFLIAGITRDYGAEHGRVLIHRSHYQNGWNDNTINSIGIYLHRESEKKEVIDQLKKLKLHNFSLRVIDSASIRKTILAVFDQTFETTQALRIIVLVIAVIAIISTLVIYQLQRREQLLTLRALGMTLQELRQLFIIQASFIGASAGLLAIPFGVVIAWLLVEIINPAAFGWTLDFHIDPLIGVMGFFIALTAGLLAAIYPCLHFDSNANITELSRE